VALHGGDALHALHLARTLLQKDSGMRQCSFIARAVEDVPDDLLALKPLKIALLSSFSIEFLHDVLTTYGLLNRLRLDIYQTGFGQFRQEILDPQSGLYAFAPEVVVLAVEGRDWFPAVYRHYVDNIDTAVETLLPQAQAEMELLLTTLRKQAKATVLMHNFAPPLWRQLGILDGHVGLGQTQMVHRINEALYQLCRAHPGCYAVDYAGLVARFGAAQWYDDRLRHYAKAPIAAAMLGHLAAEYMKFCRGLTGQTKKCVVVDLDNTLWGGVLGEDGVHGIQLGPEYPGSAYMEFQEALLTLHKRGVLLAIASKNNLADVEEVFATHPHMVLKKEHFADLQVHWKPKSQSVVDIAKKLNLGLDHLVFIDDNPVECEQVSSALPMLTTLLLPKHPEEFVAAVFDEGLFDGLNFSAEDRRRSDLYRQRDQAESLRADSGSLEDFYRSLSMQIVFAPVQAASLARAAQLTQKTNQFNVTTMRYTEAELRQRMDETAWLQTTVTVRDCFGDNGIVGLVFARCADAILHIDTFLLSCRVIGRTVETAILAYLCEQAKSRSLTALRGRIVPTAKNAPARDLFARHGFQKLHEQETESVWGLDVRENAVAWPEWFTVVVETPTQ
jgi:FkbH-like protein